MTPSIRSVYRERLDSGYTTWSMMPASRVSEEIAIEERRRSYLQPEPVPTAPTASVVDPANDDAGDSADQGISMERLSQSAAEEFQPTLLELHGDRLQQTISDLPAEESELIQAHLDGATWSQIADRTGKSESSVYLMRDRVIAKIAKMLNSPVETPTKRQKIEPGDRFGSWKVRHLHGKTASGQYKYLCQCLGPCGGTERVVPGGDLRSGKSTSCGCQHYRREKQKI